MLKRLDVNTERRMQARQRMPTTVSGESHWTPGSDALALPRRDEAT
jgi:hypothetical protein